MPNFKPKTNKKIISDSKSLITLDNKHNELLEKFNKDEIEVIPVLKNKINSQMLEFNLNKKNFR